MKKFVIWFMISALLCIHGGFDVAAYGTKYAAEIFSVRSVTAGFYNIAAIKNDGSVWAWGFNEKQVIATDADSDTSVPIQLDGISDAKTADIDIYNTVVLGRDGKVYVAGDMSYGQKAGKNGNGFFTCIDSLKGIVDVQTSAYYIEENGTVCAEPYIMALDANGDVYAWGANKRGMLGVGSSLDVVTVPTKVVNLSDITSISVCGARAAAVKSDGTLYCWGYKGNEIYYADAGESDFGTLPYKCESLRDIVSVSVGSHVLALDKNGKVYGFGNGEFGQLGKTMSTDVPTLIEEVTSLGVKKVCADTGYSVFLCTDGKLYATGRLSSLLGDTHGTAVYVPEELDAPANLTDVSVSCSAIAAQTSDGAVYVWGHGGETGVFGSPDVIGLSDLPVRSLMQSSAKRSEYSVSKSDSGVLLIENARLYAPDGVELGEMSDKFSGKIYFNAVSGKPSAAMVAFAVYETSADSSKLAAIECSAVTFEGAFDKSFNVTVPDFSPQKDYKIKAFVWDVESSLLSPYFCKSFEFET